MVTIVTGRDALAVGRRKADRPMIGYFAVGIVGKQQFNVEAAIVGLSIVKIIVGPGLTWIAAIPTPRFFIAMLAADREDIQPVVIGRQIGRSIGRNRRGRLAGRLGRAAIL